MQRKATQQSTALERTREAIRKARQHTYQVTLTLGRTGLATGKVES